MTYSVAQLGKMREPLWFCLQAQPKKEHLAAQHLRSELGVECFSPRLRFRRNTQRGPVWFVEAMFPTYLFARFVYCERHRAIQYAAAVRGIVRFGDGIAAISETVIASLRNTAADDEVVTVDPDIQRGELVHITTGPFRGLEVLVTQVLPAKERVKVLIDWLGRSVEAEVPIPHVLTTTPVRTRV